MTILFSCCAAAQSTPTVEVFGGYSYARVDVTGITHVNSQGWSASATENLNHRFGGTFEVSGYYATPQFTFPEITFNPRSSIYSVLYGPRFSFRKSERFTPSIHALLGIAHLHESQAGFSTSDNSFEAALGGELDVKINERFAIRLIQADYVYTRFRQFQLVITGGQLHLELSGPRVGQNNIRASTGIVFRFGHR